MKLRRSNEKSKQSQKTRETTTLSTPVNRLVEIPWIENNVINSVITRDQWIEHHSWSSRNDWNPSWLRHSGIPIISWRSLVVFNFNWSLVMTELMLHLCSNKRTIRITGNNLWITSPLELISFSLSESDLLDMWGYSFTIQYKSQWKKKYQYCLDILVFKYCCECGLYSRETRTRVKLLQRNVDCWWSDK